MYVYYVYVINKILKGEQTYIINRREIFQIPFFREWHVGLKLTGAHHPWEEPRVAKRYRLTPISPQSFWNPKPRTYNRAFLPVCVSVFMRMLMILISRKEKKKKKRWVAEESRKENTSVVHRARARRSGEFDKSRRVRIFVRQFFTSAERPRTRGTRCEHFSSSRSERNRPRERRSHVRRVSVGTSRVERNRWRFP